VSPLQSRGAAKTPDNGYLTRRRGTPRTPIDWTVFVRVRYPGAILSAQRGVLNCS
jgi:hypothetical protein